MNSFVFSRQTELKFMCISGLPPPPPPCRLACNSRRLRRSGTAAWYVVSVLAAAADGSPVDRVSLVVAVLSFILDGDSEGDDYVCAELQPGLSPYRGMRYCLYKDAL